MAKTMNLKAVRQTLGLTLHDAAEITGIPITTIWSIENHIHDSGAKRIALLNQSYQKLLLERNQNDKTN